MPISSLLRRTCIARACLKVARKKTIIKKHGLLRYLPPYRLSPDNYCHCCPLLPFTGSFQDIVSDFYLEAGFHILEVSTNK